MNKDRSPLWDKSITLIGILLLTVVMISTFTTKIVYNKYSEVEAKASEVTTKSNLVPAETTMVNEDNNEEEDTDEETKTCTAAFLAQQKGTKYLASEWSIVPNEPYIDDYYYMTEKEAEDLEVLCMAENVPVSTKTVLSKATSTGLKQKMVAVPAVVIEELPEEVEAEDNSSNMYYYGCLELTAYTWTGNPCADGVFPSSGYTVACNNSDLWHKWIYIEGYGDYYVHDTGGMSCGVIDVYMDSYDSCIQFGRRSANIYVYN